MRKGVLLSQLLNRPKRATYSLAYMCLAGGIASGGEIPAADWHRLGLGVPVGDAGPIVSAIAWDADGDGPGLPVLVVGGDFNTSSGAAGTRVTQWNGQSWLPMGSGFGQGEVLAFCVWDPDGDGPESPVLVAGGGFATNGNGVNTGSIAAWNGSDWESIGGAAPNGTTRALTVWDPDGEGPQNPNLVATGSFTEIGAVTVNGIARWDGANWHPLGSGFGFQRVGLALSTWDSDGAGPANPDIVVGGAFETAGGQVTRYIARWNGQQWFPLGGGVSGFVDAVCSWDPDGEGPGASVVVATGNFSVAGGASVNRIAAWNGSEWSPLGFGIQGTANALLPWDDDGDSTTPDLLVATGFFLAAGGGIAPTVASWDGTSWSRFGLGLVTTPSNAGSGHALAMFDDDGAGPRIPSLAVGGRFDIAGCDSAINVALLSRNGRCVGDVNRDGAIDFADLNEVLSTFGFTSIAPGVICADLDDDGTVNFGDLNAVLSRFGKGCD